MRHFHLALTLSAGKDGLQCVVVDAYGKILTVPARSFIADLYRPLAEVAFPLPELSAESLADMLLSRNAGYVCPNVSIVFIRSFFINREITPEEL